MKKRIKKSNRLHYLIHLICFVVVIVLLLGPKLPAPVSTSAEENITASELSKLLENKDFTLINVHTPYTGEIAKTDTFIEYDSFVASEDSLPSDKNAKIILYCQSGNMSAQALRTLKNMGYTNVRHLAGGLEAWRKAKHEVLNLANLPDKVTPAEGFTLPISWNDLGPELISLGVIDRQKFLETVQMSEAQKTMLTQGDDSGITINFENSQFVVDMLWALGLAQKSLVYTEGPMGKEYAGRAGNFASTGGWTLARGSAMEHYNKHDLIPLTPEQQKRVMDLASNVYRPCCGNHTAFPDCNHGMAALAAIELMVWKNLSDDEIYKNILKLNSFWFPQNYVTAATYFERQGVKWENIDAKLVLGSEYSSGQGAALIAKKVGPLPYSNEGSGSCGA